MKKNAARFFFSKASLACLLVLLATAVSADQIWLTPGSGFWKEGSNWNSGSPPGGTNITTVWITNSNTKVVTIDAATPATNLLVTKLNLWGPNTSTNTLHILNVTTNNPLILSSPAFIGNRGALGLANSAVRAQNSLTISNGGSLGITNSALVITGSFIFFNVYGGSATLDSGSIVVGDASVPVRVGRLTNGSLTINGGSMQVAGHMILGEGGFNNSRGTLRMTGGLLALSSFLSLGDGAGSSGTVLMSGGQLVATNSGTNGFIVVGGFGQGQMLVSNNASVTISSQLTIADEIGSTGLVSVIGGNLTVAPTSTNVTRIGNYGAAQMIVSNGTV